MVGKLSIGLCRSEYADVRSGIDTLCGQWWHSITLIDEAPLSFSGHVMTAV